MSVYSNVDTKTMLSAIDIALSEIKTNNFDSIKSEFNSTPTLKSSARSIVVNSLNSMTSFNSKTGNITKLKSNLENLRLIANYIQKYQTCEKEIVKLDAKKIKVVNEPKFTTDSHGKKHTVITSKKVTDQNVVNQIKSKKQELEKYNNEINRLLNK